MATFRITYNEEGRVIIYTNNKPSKEQIEKIKGIVLDSVSESFEVSVELSNPQINIEDDEKYFISVVDFNIYYQYDTEGSYYPGVYNAPMCDCYEDEYDCDYEELEHDNDKLIRGITSRFNNDDLLNSLKLIDVALDEMPLSIDGEIEVIDYGYDKAEDEYFTHLIDR